MISCEDLWRNKLTNGFPLKNWLTTGRIFQHYCNISRLNKAFLLQLGKQKFLTQTMQGACHLCRKEGKLASCDGDCNRRVCRDCRYDSYDRGQWVMTSCSECQIFVAHPLPVLVRPPAHCGLNYFKVALQKQFEEDERERYLAGRDHTYDSYDSD